MVAERFGYAPSTVVAMVRDFTAEAGEFFVERRPGPTVAPSKLAARDEVLRLRAAGHSVTEIAQALAAGATPLNRTGVWELLAAEGHERLAPRAPAERGAPARDDPPRVRMLRWPEQPLTLSSDHAGVMLLLPALVALDLPGAVAGARFPGTREVSALSSVLSLLALKAIGHRRVSLCKAGANGASCLQHKRRRSHSSELAVIRIAPAASRRASRRRPR